MTQSPWPFKCNYNFFLGIKVVWRHTKDDKNFPGYIPRPIWICICPIKFETSRYNIDGSIVPVYENPISLIYSKKSYSISWTSPTAKVFDPNFNRFSVNAEISSQCIADIEPILRKTEFDVLANIKFIHQNWNGVTSNSYSHWEYHSLYEKQYAINFHQV